jgi:CHAT domain-containing protein
MWGLAFAQGRSGDLAAADATANEAAAAYATIRENENLGGILFVGGEVSNLLGSDLIGRRELFRALAALRPFTTSSFRHNLLLHYGLHLAQAGYPHASLAVHREDAHIAESSGRPRDAVEALTWLGRSQVEAGLLDAGAISLSAARAKIAAIEPAGLRERLEVELAQGEAALRIKERDPAAAIALLNRAVDYFNERGNTTLAVAALAKRAAAHLVEHDTIAAEADLTLAITTFEASATRAGRSGLALFESTTPVYDALVEIHAARNQPLSALAWLERSRPGAHEPAGEHWSDTTAIAASVSALPAGRVVLVWAMLPERTLLWSIARDGIAVHSIEQRATDLVAMVDRYQNLLRNVDDTAEAALFARELYTTLIGPAGEALEGRTEVVLVPDRALDRVPFPALRDGHGSWLIERVILRHTPHLAMALEPGAAQAGPFRNPLVVSDPDYSAADFPGLPALRSATEEVATIQWLFPNATTLADTQATRSRIREQLGSHDLLHFAGHARFRNDRPELSYLVLAPEPEGSTLRARDIAELDLSALRLVILSACATHAGHDARNAGFAGLSHAFLDAGARGVLGTLWEADDEATAGFMQRVHMAMAAGRSPAAALRNAQLGMIDSPRPRLRAPAIWATFRYEGL